jgi:hypothetical protein
MSHKGEVVGGDARPRPLPISIRSSYPPVRDLRIFLPTLDRVVASAERVAGRRSSGSGGADGGAATTATALDLRAARQRPLAFFAAQIADEGVM